MAFQMGPFHQSPHKPRECERGSCDSVISALISDALGRGLTAKFFATLDAEDQLRRDLGVIVSEARRQSMRIEYLIIALKDGWRVLPEARMLPRGSPATDFLNRAITIS